ncbi:unnamed protein product [Cuscuta campestris]|uniref:PUM-HD domain-containing protein n=1 Tax=Cuscuta campestris TaxID=132261 RepID=A0A484LVY9_9ASTE|nr:unnamed protein product [Cuscuta campestris]
MLSDVARRSVPEAVDYDFSEDVESTLREQWKRVTEGNSREVERELERELSALRSGSAPPTVEGSRSSFGGSHGHGVSEEELRVRSDPEYISYYYKNVNLNPRLPPPLLSKEDLPLARKDWRADGLIGLPGLGLGRQRKSIAEVIQDDISFPTSTSDHASHPSDSRTADVAEASEYQLAHSPRNIVSSGCPLSYASALGASPFRSNTANAQRIARESSRCVPPIGGGMVNSLENPNIPNLSNDISASKTDASDLVSAFSGMSLSVNDMVVDERNNQKRQMHRQVDNQRSFLNFPNEKNHFSEHIPFSGYGTSPQSPPMLKTQRGGVNLPNSYDASFSGSEIGASRVNFKEFGGGLNMEPSFLPSPKELQNISRVGNLSFGGSVQNHPMGHLDIQSLRSSELAAGRVAAFNRAAQGSSHMDLLELQKAYVSALLSSQRSQYGPPCFSRNVGLDHQGYYGIYPRSPLAGQVFPSSSYGLGTPFRSGERDMHFPPGMKNLAGGAMEVWQYDPASNIGGNFASSLLEEFKLNKTRCFALSEIDGHVIEFSADQYGSRFIQQKLETATVEEKNMVFVEIMPQALSLMTDVFGNYVVQKFLELGSASQIRAMADKLTGHVLDLSLQMYGCRVIQKAIEVVELDQKTAMVSELDGHVMRCVRDQNGNHVIQKCIECVPEDTIQFMVTKFYDQVVTLSTHPYGCRVIQRVLEHCHSLQTQSKVMHEILQSVCMLAQDQYGNYVVQHVLVHGRPDQRSVIIDKMMGNLFQMSQQKYASNVVEKCLTYGTPEERQLLVNEILGSSDKNDPLQVLMKDQFANYVVQKVLETCDDHQLELILDRIKVHLNVLKKYTYGKHIVARVEKLVAAGERRIEFLSSYSAAQMA